MCLNMHETEPKITVQAIVALVDITDVFRILPNI